MNTRYVLFNLREAAEDLQKTISAAEVDDESLMAAWLPFVYRKLNRAWNCRHLQDIALEQETDDAFEAKCDFPRDLQDDVREKSR